MSTRREPVLLAAAVASPVAVGSFLLPAGSATGAALGVPVGVGVATVALSG